MSELLEQFLVFLFCGDELDVPADLFAQNLEGLLIQGLGGGSHLTQVEEHGDQRGLVDVDLLRQIGQGRAPDADGWSGRCRWGCERRRWSVLSAPHTHGALPDGSYGPLKTCRPDVRMRLRHRRDRRDRRHVRDRCSVHRRLEVIAAALAPTEAAGVRRLTGTLEPPP